MTKGLDTEWQVVPRSSCDMEVGRAESTDVNAGLRHCLESRSVILGGIRHTMYVVSAGQALCRFKFDSLPRARSQCIGHTYSIGVMASCIASSPRIPVIGAACWNRTTSANEYSVGEARSHLLTICTVHIHVLLHGSSSNNSGEAPNSSIYSHSPLVPDRTTNRN